MYKIAILGKANSGKNTIAKLIVKSLIESDGEMQKFIYAFADPIKEMLRLMFPDIPKKHIYGSSKFRNSVINGAKNKNGEPLTIRQALLDIGTELGRSYKDSVWLDAFGHRCEKIKNKNSIIIVPDLRFINEFNYLQDRKFFIIKVNRDNITKINHTSETEQESISDNKFNYVVNNNGTVSELKEIVKNKILPKIKDFNQ